MYDSAEEAKQKLENSCVLFEGTPVLISQIGGSKKNVTLGFVPLPFTGSTKQTVEPIADIRWDFKSIAQRLGYVPVISPLDKSHETVFVSRIPIRHSRQGLDGRTVALSYPDPHAFQYSWTDVITQEGLLTTISNRYPSIKEAFKLLTDDPYRWKSVPLHRKLLLFTDRVSPPYLLYRNEKIGYTENGVEFRLAKHKGYLREELVDMIGLKVA